jgi:glycosyltransferase involved in cell wall biosynthesis
MIVENLPVPFDRRVWQEAAALKDNGAKVTVICPRGKGYEKKREIIDSIEIYRHRLPLEANGAFGFLLEYGTALLHELAISIRCLFVGGFDVIHACNPPDLIYLIASPFKLLGKKFVFDHHDINPELYMAKFRRKDLFYRLLLYFEKRTFRHADLVIATNDSYRQIALERGGKRPEQVFVVRSGPSCTRFRVQPPVKELKKGRRFLVGYLGVIGKQEGLRYLIDAASYIIRDKARSDIHFVCIGSGPELDNVIKYAEKKEVAEYFTFTGRISDEELLNYINTADVCVNPDEYNEMNDKSTMNKVMEYMALGKAMVQFDLKEGRYSAQAASLYARNNDALDFADKILYLLEHEQLRKGMGDFGRRRIETALNWEIQSKKLIEAYRWLFEH